MQILPCACCDIRINIKPTSNRLLEAWGKFQKTRFPKSCNWLSKDIFKLFSTEESGRKQRTTTSLHCFASVCFIGLIWYLKKIHYHFTLALTAHAHKKLPNHAGMAFEWVQRAFRIPMVPGPHCGVKWHIYSLWSRDATWSLKIFTIFMVLGPHCGIKWYLFSLWIGPAMYQHMRILLAFTLMVWTCKKKNFLRFPSWYIQDISLVSLNRVWRCQLLSLLAWYIENGLVFEPRFVHWYCRTDQRTMIRDGDTSLNTLLLEPAPLAQVWTCYPSNFSFQKLFL